MDDAALGKPYADGDIICRQGEPGDRMFVMQEGRAVVSREDDGRSIVLSELGAGDIFGEMAIFDREPRSATVRAKGSARVLTLDKRGFLKRVHEDPSLAYRILRDMSHRIRKLDHDLARLRPADGRASRYVLVVAPDRPELFQRLSEEFADDDTVEVVLDRRIAKEHRAHDPRDAEHGQQNRRRRDADALLRAHGMMIVRARGPR